MKQLLQVGLLFFSFCAFADEVNQIQIRQLMVERNRAVVESKAPLKEDAELIATFPDQKQCPLKVITAKENLANVDTGGCARASELKIGQTLEPSLALEEKLPAPALLPVPPPPPGNHAVEKSRSSEPENVKREITDLQYMPEFGKLGMALQFEQRKSEVIASLNSNGKQIYDDNNTQEQMNGEIDFGLTKELSGALGWGWVTRGTDDTVYGPGSTLNGLDSKTQNLGYIDPVIALKYRVTEMGTYNSTTDLIFAYSPKVASKTLGTLNSNGNGVRGGDVIALAAEVGQKYSMFSYVTHLGVSIYGTETAYNVDTSAKSTISSYNQAAVSIAGQFRASDKILFRLGLDESYWSSQTASAPGVPDVNIDSYVQTTLGIAVVGEIMPNACSLFVNFSKSLDASLTGNTGGVDLKGTANGSNLTVTLAGQF
jgi:hypothetical protein